MMMKKLLVICFMIISSIFFLWFFYLKDERELRLTKEGDALVQKVENYRAINGSLPISIEQLGIKVIDETNPPLYYEKRDSISYVIWFSMGAEEIKAYYSKSQKWENKYHD